MKLLKHFLIALLTVFLCIFLPYFFDSSNYLTAVFATSNPSHVTIVTDSSKSTTLSFSVLATTSTANQTETYSLVQQSQALYEAGQFMEAVQLLKKQLMNLKLIMMS